MSQYSCSVEQYHCCQVQGLVSYVLLQDYKLRYQLDPLVKQEVLQKEQARVRATVRYKLLGRLASV